jgi:hypothetical protein
MMAFNEACPLYQEVKKMMYMEEADSFLNHLFSGGAALGYGVHGSQGLGQTSKAPHTHTTTTTPPPHHTHTHTHTWRPLRKVSQGKEE